LSSEQVSTVIVQPTMKGILLCLLKIFQSLYNTIAVVIKSVAEKNKTEKKNRKMERQFVGSFHFF
jgi:hypothetical protein